MKVEELDKPAIDPGPDHIVGEGYNFETVTDKIQNVVLRPLKTTPWQWFAGITIAFLMLQGLLFGRHCVLESEAFQLLGCGSHGSDRELHFLNEALDCRAAAVELAGFAAVGE